MHRVEIPLDKKKQLFEESIKTIVDHSNRIVTMEKLAQIISTKKKLTPTSLPKLIEVTTCLFSEIIVSDMGYTRFKLNPQTFQ